MNPKIDLNLNPKRRAAFSVRALLVACALIAAGAAAIHRFVPRNRPARPAAQLSEVTPAALPPAPAAPQLMPLPTKVDGAAPSDGDLTPPPEDGSGS